MCGLNHCPILENIGELLPARRIIRGHIETETPPGVFVGTYGYPQVYAGPTAMFERDFWDYNSDKFGLSMEKIISIHSNIYRTGSKVNIRKVDERLKINLMESSSSVKPLEISFDGRMSQSEKARESFFETPVGPLAMVENLKIQGNPKIPGRVDYFYNDPYEKASEAVWELFRSNMGVSYIQNLLTAGVLGVKNERKMVPTRWAITATDDIIFKKLKSSIIRNPWVDGIEFYSRSFLGNSFHIFIFPGSFSFEMQERWNKGSLWGEGRVQLDYEGIENRKNYASVIAGAYYAARLSVSQNLYGRGRQGKIVVMRSVGNEYYSPLGVWVIRRTVEEAMKEKPVKFSSMDELVREIRPIIPEGFTISKTMREMAVQRKLEDF